jgi:uncharacterized membrane protein
MPIVLMMAALAGGVMTCILLWPYGAVIALVGMPFGGSLSALFAAILLYMRTSAADEAHSDKDDRTVDPDQPQTSRAAERSQESHRHNKFGQPG